MWRDGHMHPRWPVILDGRPCTFLLFVNIFEKHSISFNQTYLEIE